ncbi:nascent polypeptide-associated complex subunit alpha, muscle-specific form-like [Pipra filicauda]|uniref:Nascent polypeptide-associated complex subunit alpha, muscle-specific form-like n=1 Tax=Pipra filicauda TaxID=649802 RepID=A0A7R5KUB5_9PASS|nr:nascent polypeptide-associated complex subunit alpha, muscle-specific form-like [Pipra filicauda]
MTLAPRCPTLQPACWRRTSPAPRHQTARHATPAPELLPGPLPTTLSVTRRGLCARPPSCPISLPWPPSTSPPPHRGAGAPTTSFSSPTKDVPVPLGELLSWVSDVSRSWMGSRGAREAAAARRRSPAQCGWMSISPPLIAATEPVPCPGAGWTAPEDVGTCSLALCTCQSPRAETGAAVPGQPVAREAPTGSPNPSSPCTPPPPQGRPPGAVLGSPWISMASPSSPLLSSTTCKSSHVTLRLRCRYCSHYPVWLCMRRRCPRLRDASHSLGPPVPRPSLIGASGAHRSPKQVFWGQNTKILTYTYCEVSVKGAVWTQGSPARAVKENPLKPASSSVWSVCPSSLATVAVGWGLSLPPVALCHGLLVLVERAGARWV